MAVKLDYILNTWNSNQELLGLPKVLIVDSCRGSRDTSGLISEHTKGPELHCMWEYLDILIARSSVPGFVPYATGGRSTFIQFVAEELERWHSQENLFDILTNVTSRMSKFSSYGQFQTPQIVSTFTKKLFFYEIVGKKSQLMEEKKSYGSTDAKSTYYLRSDKNKQMDN